jgi:hypothetical protein
LSISLSLMRRLPMNWAKQAHARTPAQLGTRRKLPHQLNSRDAIRDRYSLALKSFEVASPAANIYSG